MASKTKSSPKNPDFKPFTPKKPLTGNHALTLTLVTLGMNANYAESMGNVATLKKLSRNDGRQYTYISRQALYYSIVKQLGWDVTPIEAQGSGDKKVLQFASQATIENYPEIDLRGYFKTTSKKEGESGSSESRSAVARLTPAISLEPFHGDWDFLATIGMAARAGENPNLAQREVHYSHYEYTLAIDLDRVGVDKEGTENEINLSAEEKTKRVFEFLDVVEGLTRDLGGAPINLAPLFVIGGVYDRKQVPFANRVKMNDNKIMVEPLNEIKQSQPWLKEKTLVGTLHSYFDNYEEIKSTLNATSVADVFAAVKKEVKAYYESN